MSVISRFTKNIRVLDYRGYLNANINEEVTLSQIQAYFRDKSRKLAYSSGVKRIQLSDHAVNRWNERVGPIMDKSSLEEALNSTYLRLRCFQLTSGTTGIIDDDILFTYSIQNDIMTITTFYGRNSLNFLLNRFFELRNYNKYEHNKIDLSIHQRELVEQILPPMPCEAMVFEGSANKYLIEKYMDGDSTLLYVYVLSGNSRGKIIEVDPASPPDRKLSQSVLRALHIMGYGEYVYQYLNLYKGNQINKYLQKKQLQISA